MVTKIISGGQTGADMGGLLAGELLHIPIGGTCPDFYVDENGFNPDFIPRFKLKSGGNYRQRTEQNIIDSDLTLVFAKNIESAGSKLTIELCKKHGKPFHVVRTLLSLKSFIRNFNHWSNGILNIAGNRESVSPGICAKTRDFLISVLMPENGYFVFGSNSNGIHGKGAAKTAKIFFGAKDGIARGLCGKSYAIVTKADFTKPRSSSLEEIKTEIDSFYSFAKANKEKLFFVTEIGCGLAGYHYTEIASLFDIFYRESLPNVFLPKRFTPNYFVSKMELNSSIAGETETLDEIEIELFKKYSESVKIKEVSVKTEEKEEKIEPDTKSGDFVHLHVHSVNSILDGMCEFPDLFTRMKEIGQDCIALTDHGYLYGNYKFQKAAEEYEIKPIHGVEAYFVNNALTKDHLKSYHLVLLCMNEIGWKNLCYMMTMANRDRFYNRPRIDESLLREYNEGLICLSACYKSPVTFHLMEEGYDPDRARANALFFKETFGDRFYNEAMHIGWEDYDKYYPRVLELADDLKIKTVCTNDVHFVKRSDAKYQEMLTLINTKGKMTSSGSDEFYLKTRDEMIVDYITPEMCDRTLEIADRCNFNLNFSGYLFPEFKPETKKDYKEFLEWKRMKLK